MQILFLNHGRYPRIHELVQEPISLFPSSAALDLVKWQNFLMLMKDIFNMSNKLLYFLYWFSPLQTCIWLPSSFCLFTKDFIIANTFSNFSTSFSRSSKCLLQSTSSDAYCRSTKVRIHSNRQSKLADKSSKLDMTL